MQRKAPVQSLTGVRTPLRVDFVGAAGSISNNWSRKMQLTVRDVAEMIEVDEKTIVRWVKDRKIHAHRIGGQFLFDRLDLFELAMHHELPELSPEIVERILALTGDESLASALEAGGVVNGVAGTDAESVWQNIVDLLPVPTAFGREALLKLFLTRDFFHATALSGGIAMPHPRRPLVLPVPAPVAMLCRLQQPLVLGNGSKAVDTVFVVMSPTVRSHLLLLAQFVRSLRDHSFDSLIAHYETAHAAPASQLCAVVG
jgi:PTS system nitrogen regulatory IIA component